MHIYSNFDPECPARLGLELQGDIVDGEGIYAWPGNGSEKLRPQRTDFLFIHHWTAKKWNDTRRVWGLRASRSIFTYRKTAFVMLLGDHPEKDQWLVDLFNEVANEISDKTEIFVVLTEFNTPPDKMGEETELLV